MADEVDEIAQALKRAPKEDSRTYRINHSLLNFLKGMWSLLTSYAVIFLAFVEPEVVQHSDTGVKAPIGFSPLSQWEQRCDSRYIGDFLSSTVIYLAETPVYPRLALT